MPILLLEISHVKTRLLCYNAYSNRYCPSIYFLMNNELDISRLENTLDRYRQTINSLIIAAAVIAAAAIAFCIMVAYPFLWGLLAVIPLLISALWLSVKYKKLKPVLQVRRDWGCKEAARERDFKSIRYFFDFTAAGDESNRFIDDQTWKDLNLDRLFTRLDRTYTDPGSAVLYRILREPLFEKTELAERTRIIQLFQKDRPVREKVQVRLVRLGWQFVSNDIFTLLWRDSYPAGRKRWLYTGLAILALASLFLPLVFWSWTLLAAPVAMFLINLFVHYSTRRQKDLEIISFPYLINCIKAAGNLSGVEGEELSPYTQKLKELYQASRGVIKKARFLVPVNTGAGDPTAGIFLDYLNIFFLLEVRAFFNTSYELSRHALELREIYLLLGKLDALQSIASYRAALSVYAEPEFVDSSLILEIRDARQPLLDDPVPATITFNKNIIIITGSNMGGKSTFLRTVGTNVLLAQTVVTPSAAYYRGSFYRIITSISRTDDLVAGKSFYYVEAERVLRAIRGLDGKAATLCIIDELLSGTNSTERLQASEAIIRFLSGRNTLAVIATHDLELAGRLNGICDFYHFSGSVNENGLKFDYQLKPGIAISRNAIALLKYLGYPGEITNSSI